MHPQCVMGLIINCQQLMIHAPPFLFAAEVWHVCAVQVAELSSGDGSKRITSSETQFIHLAQQRNVYKETGLSLSTSLNSHVEF